MRMISVEVPTIPIEILASNLTSGDDPALWEEVLQSVAEEFTQHRPERMRVNGCALIIGACSHWNRPHQTRWTAGGGFAYPEGYKQRFPVLDWSVTLLLEGGNWRAAEKLPAKGMKLFQIAVPSRTARHNQAAIQARWSTAARAILFGFRKIAGKWQRVALADF